MTITKESLYNKAIKLTDENGEFNIAKYYTVLGILADLGFDVEHADSAYECIEDNCNYIELLKQGTFLVDLDHMETNTYIIDIELDTTFTFSIIQPVVRDTIGFGGNTYYVDEIRNALSKLTPVSNKNGDGYTTSATGGQPPVRPDKK